MFQRDLEIFSINGKDTFLNITADNFCFDEGKVTFIFGRYDLSKEKGKRTTERIKIWLPIEDANYLGDILSTNKLKALDLLVQNGQKEYRPYYHSGGGIKKGKILARQLYIDLVKEKNSKYYCSIAAIEGPGIKSSKGLFTWDKSKKKERKSFKFGLSYEDTIKMGLQLKRAIQLFDIMSANGNLETTIQKLKKNN